LVDYKRRSPRKKRKPLRNAMNGPPGPKKREMGRP